MNVRRRLLANSALTVLLVLGVAVAANYLSARSFVRVDLSGAQEFSLSDGAKQIVRGLDAPVTVEVFLSSDLPAQFALHTQRIRDKLDEFAAVAPVPFDVTYTDPGDDADARSRARRLGVEPRETSARSRGKVEAQITFLGMAILYRDGTEVLPFIDTTTTLEYEISRALRRLQGGDVKPVLGFVAGHGEADVAAVLTDENAARHPLMPVAQVLADTYDLRTVDLATATEVPADVDVLIDLGARGPLSGAAVAAIDQHLMRGGALGVFPYSALPDVQSRQIHPAPVDFDGLLEPWGVTIGDDLVVDRKLNGVIRLPVKIRVRGGVRTMEQAVSTPLVPILRNLDRDHPVTRRMDSLVAPFARAIDVSEARAAGDVDVTVLAGTSAEATVGATVRSLDPRTLAEPQEAEEAGSWPVLVALSGTFESGLEGAAIDQSPEGTRLVVGSSFELPFANPGLLLNLVDWMAADEILLSIRPRMTSPSVLERPENVTLVRLLNVAGLPLLVGLAGVVRLRRRSGR